MNQLSKEELVEIIIEQGKAICELQKTILELQQEVERLKVSRDLDSSTSSKPPSGDILKKSENKTASLDGESNHPKTKPGGQPGHQGKTRKGFGKPNVHVDETPWSVKGIKEWLWVVANSDFCLFTAADTRSRAELETILGTKYGVLSSDDFSVYNGYAVSDQQKCLAHLRRHFKKQITALCN